MKKLSGVPKANFSWLFDFCSPEWALAVNNCLYFIGFCLINWFVSVTGSISLDAYCTRDQDKMHMEDSFCNVDKKPTLKTYKCDAGDCKVPFYWKADYGKCNAKCGKGM